MICANKKCSKDFTPGKPWGKYCSEECGDKARHQRYYRRQIKRPCVHGTKLGTPAGNLHRHCARKGSV